MALSSFPLTVIPSVAAGRRAALRFLQPKRHTLAVLGVGGGVAVGGAALGAGPFAAGAYEAYHTSSAWKRSQEAVHMSRVLSTMQTGPFGTGTRPYGMGWNHGNASGMSLALHYARNGTGIPNPMLSMAGMAGPMARRIGGML